MLQTQTTNRHEAQTLTLTSSRDGGRRAREREREREREKGEETHTRDRRKRHLHSHLTAAPRHQRPRTVLMANQTVFQKLKSRWIAETKDEEKVAAHLRLLRAAALFAGSVFLMRSFGDLMAV